MLKRYFIPAVLTLCTSHAATAQLVVGPRMTACDNLTGTRLCSVPEECFGSDLSVESILLDGINHVTINGIDASNGYTFSNIDGTKTWQVSTTLPDGTIVSTKLQFTFLPIVEINGTVEKLNYNTGSVTVLLPDENIVSPCKMKYRGSASNSHVLFKRNYHLKFQDENGNFVPSQYFSGVPDKMEHPEYTEKWKEVTAKDNGTILEAR